jgi:type VI secretion system protein ImpK
VHTLRFASNWDLSQERAEAVKRLLATRLADRARLSAQGRGEMDPVAPNDTASGRARNRRVEITLMLAPTAGSAQPAAGTP